jgi:ABC-type transport system involved in multi-copper enzyme maturation permease subunit
MYSLIQAISLYAEASGPALVTTQMASGLNPFDGVIVPTYGSIYLALTLLFPFVAIRSLSSDKDSGALTLLLQTPLPPSALLASKVGVLFLTLFLAELPGLFALLLWRLFGGHLYVPEILCLLLGHFLYGLLIIAISLFAATISESASTAALLALACTLGSWVLDFAAGGNSWLTRISGFSLTAALKPFEQGLIAWNVVAGIVVAVAGLLALTLIWWHPGRPLSFKLSWSAAVLVGGIVCFSLSHFLARSVDLTEDQRHSFSPEVSAKLGLIREPVRVTVYLAAEDPRLMDFDRAVLKKLLRVLPRTEILNREASQSAVFKTGEDPNYGLIVYEIGARRAESRSTSPEEVLPLLFSLAGVDPPASENVMNYPGYPLVVKLGSCWDPFLYALWPACSFVAWFFFSRR